MRSYVASDGLIPLVIKQVHTITRFNYVCVVHLEEP